MLKKLFVIDLDGTLVKGNSFNFFVTCLLMHSLQQKTAYSLYLACKIVFISIMRKLRVFSHNRMKRLLQKIWRYYVTIGHKEILRSKVQNYIDGALRTEVVSFVSDKKTSGDRVIIATAAPEEYVSIIAELIPIIDHFIATPAIISKVWYHNLSEIKWENVSAFIGEDSYYVISFTDHYDDLPLIKNSNKTYLFSPLADEIEMLKKQVTTDLIVFGD